MSVYQIGQFATSTRYYSATLPDRSLWHCNAECEPTYLNKRYTSESHTNVLVIPEYCTLQRMKGTLWVTPCVRVICQELY